MKICPYCKSENHDDAVICKECRSKISKSAMTANVFENFATLVQGCGCLGMIIGAIIILCIIFFSN